jgi:hypothetical protein
MSFDTRGHQAPNYLPVRYGTSRLTFRGPKRRMEGDFVVVLGSTETYGKFIETPYPDLVEGRIGMPIVNFGCVNAGVDAFAYDPTVLEAVNDARAVVVQIMGAQNMSNRLYTVHPRRNDRFLDASALLKAVYREVDFTEFHFTRHMLNTLRDIDAARFEMVRNELKQAWTARMRMLLQSVNRPVLLLWFSDRDPPAEGAPDLADPMFVDAEMLDRIAPASACLVEVVASQEALNEGVSRMAFDAMDLAAAQEQLSVMAHEEAGARLARALGAVLTPN